MSCQHGPAPRARFLGTAHGPMLRLIQLSAFPALELLQDFLQLLRGEAEIGHPAPCPATKPRPSKALCTCCSSYKPSSGSRHWGGRVVYEPGRCSGFAGSSDTTRCPALPLGRAAHRTTTRSSEPQFRSASTFLLLALTWLFLNMEFSACKFTPFCNTSSLSSVDKPRELHLSSQRRSRTLQLPPGPPLRQEELRGPICSPKLGGGSSSPPPRGPLPKVSPVAAAVP